MFILHIFKCDLFLRGGVLPQALSDVFVAALEKSLAVEVACALIADEVSLLLAACRSPSNLTDSD